MELYFSKADTNWDTELDSLYYEDENYFYYKLEVSDDFEDFAIADTCNRFIPFCKEDLPKLARVLAYVNDVVALKKRLKEDYDNAAEDLADFHGINL